MNSVIIGVGSNINATENIKKSITILEKEQKLIKKSTFIKTKPIGRIKQSYFTNGVLSIKTYLSQNEFNKYLKNIENFLHRDHSLPKFGPRTIDLDILIWNNKIVDKDIYSRDFLINGINEIDASLLTKTDKY